MIPRGGVTSAVWTAAPSFGCEKLGEERGEEPPIRWLVWSTGAGRGEGERRGESKWWLEERRLTGGASCQDYRERGNRDEPE